MAEKNKNQYIHHVWNIWAVDKVHSRLFLWKVGSQQSIWEKERLSPIKWSAVLKG